MLKLAALFCLLANALGATHPPFKVIFEWNATEFNWASPEALDQAIKHKEYIVENNAIAGIKIWKNKMYLTIPRWRKGVPVTLGVTSATPVNDVTAPKLDPYPNWDMQTLGDCNAFQFVQSMEIDPLGRMWVLDTGRTETMELKPEPRCPPRLVILDLENEGAVLRSYVFPKEVAPPDSAYLNDIVVDHENGGAAYITDNGHDDPGIIVFTLKDNKSRKVRHKSMRAEGEAENFVVAGVNILSPMHVDGIALSPPGGERQVYYSPLSSFHLYAISTSILRNDSLTSIEDSHVQELGRKSSQTDGMVMTNQGVLYFGLLADDAIAMWDTNVNPSFASGLRVISRDHSLTQWPDTFAIDESGHLWCVTNALQNYMNHRIDINRPNFRVVSSSTAAKNYQYNKDGTIPALPVITAAADRVNFTLSLCLTILLVFLAR
ncbi:protein yellow-like [Athalia rosae]|uniref:protein yellow-like n=1 Tax=Athalia rosae TaxID=37344 RepID=UPI0020339D64|nr:protein yellow-like [Athalia rosae]